MLCGTVQRSHSPRGSIYRFSAYEADTARGELRKFGTRIRLERKPWALLIALLERAGTCVTREELKVALWSDGTFVDFEHGLNVAIKKLRSALCDSAEAPSYIETVPGRGYRFIAPVTQDDVVADDIVLPEENATVAIDHETTQQCDEPAPRLRDEASRGSGRNFAFWTFFFLVVLAISASAALIWVKHSSASGIPHATNVSLQRFLYVANYSGSGVVTYKINPFTGALKQVAENRSGEHPFFATVLDGDFVYVANRGRADGVCGRGCTISGYAIDQVSGTLTELDGSPYPVGTAPLAIAIHPSRRYAYVTDVINHLYVYERSETGELKRVGDGVRVGARPFYVTVSPSGKFVYVANQDDATVSGFSVAEDGTLHEIPGSPFATGLRPRAFLIHPNAKFAFVVNYGVDPFENHQAACVGTYGSAHGRGCSVSVFSIDPKTGALAEIAGSPFESDGTNPLGSVMDREGKYLFIANISSNNVSVFRIDASTGTIRQVHGSPFPTGEGPSALTLDEGGFLYILNTEEHTVSQYSVDFETGRLTSIGSEPVPGLGATSIAAQRTPRP